jgi:hypothetical protein
MLCLDIRDNYNNNNLVVVAAVDNILFDGSMSGFEDRHIGGDLVYYEHNENDLIYDEQSNDRYCLAHQALADEVKRYVLAADNNLNHGKV